MTEVLGIKKLTRPTTGRPTTAKINSDRERNRKIEDEFDESDVNLKEIREESMVMLSNVNENQGGTENYEISEGNNANNLHNVYKYDSNSLEQKSELEKIISEENERIEFLETQKQKLKQIELIEKDTVGLYDWKTLFTKSRPITAYTCTNLKFSYYNNQEEEKNNHSRIATLINANTGKSSNAISNADLFGTNTNTNSNSAEGKGKEKIKEKPFKFPVALIDEKEEVIHEFITIHKNISAKRKKMEEALKLSNKGQSVKKAATSSNFYNSNGLGSKSTFSLHTSKVEKEKDSTSKSNLLNKSQKMNTARGLRSNATRPQSVFARRGDDDVFYLDKGFSDYFTQEESEFARKFPLLHPKVRCNSKSLKKTLKVVKHSNIQCDQMSTRLKNKEAIEEDIKIENRELNLAGQSKNPIPLLKSIYKQMNSELIDEPINPHKMYLNSNKPLGNSSDRIDYKKNMRNENMLPFYPKRERFESSEVANKELILEMYNSNDPEIQIFHEIEEKVFPEMDDLPEVDMKEGEENDIFEDLPEKKEKRDQAVGTVNKPKSKLTTRPQTAANLNKFNANASSASKLKSLTNRQSNSRERSLSPKENKKHPGTARRIEVKTISESHLPVFSNKALPLKEKPNSHPHAYQVMRNNLNYYSMKNENKFFDDVIQVENINEEIKEDLRGPTYTDLFCENAMELEGEFREGNRPFTSSNFRKRPFSKMVDRISKGESKFGTLTIDSQRRGSKDKSSHKFNNKNSKKVNNIYFNEYIDMQFRVMNSTSKTNFFNKKEDSQYTIKKMPKNAHNLDNERLGDLIVVSNLNLSNRNQTRTAKSARVKV